MANYRKPIYKTSEMLRTEYVHWRATMGAPQEPITKNVVTRCMNKAGFTCRRRGSDMMFSIYIGKGATVDNG